jgi:hypothetical protein
MTTTILLHDVVGPFAEDKDAARDLRINQIEPALDAGVPVELDFAGVPLATQSFLHAMLSATIRSRGAQVLDQIVFKNCSPAVKPLVALVAEYSQETDAMRDRRTRPEKRPSTIASRKNR